MLLRDGLLCRTELQHLADLAHIEPVVGVSYVAFHVNPEIAAGVECGDARQFDGEIVRPQSTGVTAVVIADRIRPDNRR